MEVQKRGDGGPWALNSIGLATTPRCFFRQHQNRNGSSSRRCNNQGFEGVMHLSLRHVGGMEPLVFDLSSQEKG